MQRFAIIARLQVSGLPLSAGSANADYTTLLEGRLAALTSAAEEDIGRLHELAQSPGSTTESNVTGTVTSDLARAYVDKPAGFNKQLQALQNTLQASLVTTAREVQEEHRSRLRGETDAGAVYASLRGAATARADEIATAVGDNNISVMTVYLTMQLFMNVNTIRLPPTCCDANTRLSMERRWAASSPVEPSNTTPVRHATTPNRPKPYCVCMTSSSCLVRV